MPIKWEEIREERRREKKGKEILIKFQVIQSSLWSQERIQLAFSEFGEKKKEGSIRNQFLFEDFKLGRYIFASLESEVNEAY